MIVFPFAKINVGLRITERRQDGYHNIETVFYPVGLNDALEFVAADEGARADVIDVTGLDTGSVPEDNLVIKAASVLREMHHFPYLKIHLHKAIPAGAGLGGGSSDAACLIRSVNRHFSLGMTQAEMSALSLSVGSDCPFFIQGVPAAAYGRGEILSPVKPFLEGYHLVLMNPGVHVSTREAYGNCRPGKPDLSPGEITGIPVRKWKEVIFNDFEPYAFTKHPVIADLKQALYDAGALFSLMSGSGSSVFGIFDSKPGLSPELKSFVIYEGKI